MLMATLPVYRRNAGAPRSNPRFPEDFTVAASAQVPEELVGRLTGLPLHCWFLRAGPRTQYATCKKFADGKRVTYTLQNVVWEMLYGPTPAGLTVDHIDHDGLNCLADNLRLATRAQQCANQKKRRTHGETPPSSPFKGLTWNLNCSKWHAQITVGKRIIYLGLYVSDIEAAFAYNLVCREAYGEFAVPNDIPGDAISPERQAWVRGKVKARLARTP